MVYQAQCGEFERHIYGRCEGNSERIHVSGFGLARLPGPSDLETVRYLGLRALRYLRPKSRSSGASIMHRFNGNEDHAVVIHAGNGERIGCGVLTAASGGIHIHEGTSCDVADEVGPHFWTPAEEEDPWIVTTYTSSVDGTAMGSFMFENGYSYKDNVGHAVVVHHPATHPAIKAKIGCGVLESGKGKKGSKSKKKDSDKALVGSLGPYPGGGEYYASGGVTVSGSGTALTFDYDLDIGAPSLVATMSTYPDYTGASSSVSGKVYAKIDAYGQIDLEYDLEGMEADCTTCEIHIHAGITCDVADEVGGHYWITKDDPWGTSTQVKSQSDGTAEGNILGIFSGYGYAGNEGHAVVIHDSTGTKIACGVLTAASGGIHIHEGTSCDMAGGHYWTPAEDEDVWITTKYSASTSTPAGSFSFDNGYTLKQNDGHTVVVHAPNGKRISCGVINERKGKCNGKKYAKAAALVESCSGSGRAMRAQATPILASTNGWSTATLATVSVFVGMMCGVMSAFFTSARNRNRVMNPERQYMLPDSVSK